MPDLNTIPGFSALQALTLGDTRIKIAVLDGPADLDRACFKGAKISRIKPFWQIDLDPIDPFYIQQELKIRDLSDQKKSLKKELKNLKKQNSETVEASNIKIEEIASTIAEVTPSDLGRSHKPSQTIFNAVLENANASSLEQYHQLKEAQQHKAIFKTDVSVDNPNITENTTTIESLEAAIAEIEAEIESLQESIPKPIAERMNGVFHATGIFGTMFGQPGSPVEGVAPYCTVINIPLFETSTSDEALSPLNLAHAFNLALELGVNIIHCAACHPTQTGFAHEMIQKAVKQCQDNNILIVAPAGNNKGECFCAPAILPNVLAVGMMKDNGQPANYSNWGGQYQKQGILAPGENIPAAKPGTDEPDRQEGTSLAAPLMTGLCALMMSLQLQRGEQPNAEAVRTAFLNTVIPCDPNEVEEPDRCLAGKLNLPGAYQHLTGHALLNVQPTAASYPEQLQSSGSGRSIPDHLEPSNSSFSSQAIPPGVSFIPIESVTASAPIPPSPRPPVSPSTITPSALSNLVYALGTIGYDFGSEARRDIFLEQMPTSGNPYDTRQMVDYLDQYPSESKALIWALNQELTPLYVLEPKGAFAHEIYAIFQMMLDGQLQTPTNENYIERVSICGKLTDRTVELLSGQVVPVVTLHNVRGMYGWHVNSLVEHAVASIRSEVSEANIIRIRRSLRNFLHRVYYDLKNPGQLDRDRALNFAATNTFQAASTFATAVAHSMELDDIEVEKSPFCRLDSNCWDVKLSFFDPENGRRAKKIFRFTIDVKDALPVTLGEVRSWSVPRN